MRESDDVVLEHELDDLGTAVTPAHVVAQGAMHDAI
jgi:hypothetical protein